MIAELWPANKSAEPAEIMDDRGMCDSPAAELARAGDQPVGADYADLAVGGGCVGQRQTPAWRAGASGSRSHSGKEQQHEQAPIIDAARPVIDARAARGTMRQRISWQSSSGERPNPEKMTQKAGQWKTLAGEIDWIHADHHCGLRSMATLSW